jgi:Ctr copper transporter family
MIRKEPAAFEHLNLFARPSLSETLPHLSRTLLSFVVILLDFSLMLLAMTFNVGIFFAVCLGLALGLLLFQPVSQRYTQRLQVHLDPSLFCTCLQRTRV